MKRIIIFLLSLVILVASIFAMSSCYLQELNKDNEETEATYSLNSGAFNKNVAFGEDVDLSTLFITKTEGSSTTNIPVDKSMVSCDTSSVGQKTLTVTYMENVFQLNVHVKYRVIFRLNGEMIDTQYVLTPSDIVTPTVTVPENQTFDGWNIPDTIANNVIIEARTNYVLPALSNVTAEYDSTLGSISLPENENGKWVFALDDSVKVKDAGSVTQYDVNFVLNGTSEIVKTERISVTVVPKKVNFSNVVTSFTYNGSVQLPTYSVDADVKTDFVFDAEGDYDYTSVGTYSFTVMVVDEANYEGEISGTYVINPANVTVRMHSYNIFAYQSVPELEYDVEGFDNPSLLGLEITKPVIEEKDATYTLTATTKNKNVNLTVVDGTLTVTYCPPEIAVVGLPTLKSNYATYEDLLSSLEFEYNNFGTWSWKNPSDSVGNVGKNKHVAVFEHNAYGYAPLTYEIEIEVRAKELNISVVGQTAFDYDGDYHSLSYIVTDALGNDYSHLTILGNEQYKNAGTYTVSLYVENQNYSAFAQATLIINKIAPVTDFSKTFEAVWSPTLKLSDFKLDDGYQWLNPDEKISTAGTHSYSAVFTPGDTENYTTVQGEFEITVAKASASINNVNNSYSFIYNGAAIALDSISGSHSDSELEFAYVKDGKAVSSITDVGTYSVTITLPETTNYESATATTEVTVTKADIPTDNLATKQSATYGDLLSTLTLPKTDLGEWSFKDSDESTTVGNAGTNYFTAVFTPNTENYNTLEVTITVNVAKLKVDAPAVAEDKKSQTYTGSLITSGITSGTGYTVKDDGGINIGTYEATLSLVSENYVWSDGTSADKTREYTVTRAENSWTTTPSIKTEWVFGDTDELDKTSEEYKAYLGYAKAKYGTVTVKYSVKGSESFTDTLPTNAGTYTARFEATHPNAESISKDIDFTITKKKIDLPTYTKEFTYTGSSISSGITATDYYTVEDAEHTDVGSYAAYATLSSVNYVWADGVTTARREFKYSITKATIVISGFTASDVVYGNAPAPTASATFSAEITYLYSTSINGEYTETVPTNAGDYYVKATAEGNDNLNGAETSPLPFKITKAPVTLSGYESSYEIYYNGNAFAFTGITASNDGDLSYAITKDGVSATEIKSVGVYSVTISLSNTDNHTMTPVTVTVTVKQALNNDSVDTAQEATYGDLISTLTLPESTLGEWSFKNADETTTVGNAGTNTFTAVFTPDDEVNYASREVTITVTVDKKTVELPTVEHKTYDGSHFYSGLTTDENSLYVITEDLGGTEKGTYSVTLKLKDKDNYKWENTAEESVTINYNIAEAVNNWKTQPSIKSTWEYGDTGNEGTAEAEFGDVIVKYKPKDAADTAYSTTLPTIPGSYTAYFASTDTNYNILEKTIDFTITKKKIDVPTISKNEFAYTGSNITLGVPASSYYTVTDNGGTDVDSYTATVTLNNAYYVWSDKDENLTKTFSYSIIKANVTLTNLSVTGWTYGEDANTPTVTKNFSVDVDFLYSTSADGEYTETVPTDAGTYFVKASFGGNDNLNAAQSTAVSFEIEKATATINGASDEAYTKAYDGNAYTFTGITASFGSLDLTSSLKYSLTGIKNAGTYTVVISLDSKNYTAESVTVTLEITKAANNDTIPTYTATYGDLLSTLSVPSSTTGSWSWKNITDETTVGNAGPQKHTLVFAPTDSTNYAAKEVEVTVTVYKAVVKTPTLTTSSYVYDAKSHNAGLATDTRYTFTDAGATNVGTHTVTLTLANPQNYAWDNKDNTSTTTTVTYTITSGTNSLSNITMNGWTYGNTGTAGSATAKYGSVLVEYKLASAADTAYSTTLPTAAGDYVARFSTTDTNCPILTDTRTFTIAKATVTTPSLKAASTVYTGSKITSGITAGTLYNVYDNGGTNVGSYTARVELKDKNNYKWSTTDESADVEFNYSITAATITISNLSASWTYGAVNPSPTVKTNVPCTVIYYYYDANGGELGTTAPTSVGDYTVKAVVETTTNYTGAEASTTFSVGRATPVFANPYFVGGTHYKNDLVLSTDITAYNENNSALSVPGTFVYGDVQFAEGTNASSVTLTFTPNDRVNYKSVTVTYNFTLVTVANLNKSTPYGSIEDAIDAANKANGGTVWVLPNASGMGAICINSSITINSGVTLLLPYGTRDSYSKNSSSKATLSGGSDIANESKCTTLVKLAEGITITNYGTIEIAGELSGGGGEKHYAGHTAGSHARLLLSDNASIISENGSSIKCYGFLYNESSDTTGSSVIIKSGATIYQPFILEDFRGGSYMAGINNSISTYEVPPFNRFLFMNVSVPLTINYGGSLIGWANLYASKQQNATDVYMIGSNSSYVIQLTDEGGYVNARYVPPTDNSTIYHDAKCYLDIYGGAQTNAMTLKITLAYILPVEINTSSCYFPISHYYQITLNKTDSQTSAYYKMNQNFKLLTGSSLTVGEGVTLEATKLVVYEEFIDTFDPDDDANKAYILYPEKEAAIFTVNGNFICEQFGGKIYSDINGATIKITTIGITAYEAIAKDGNNNTNTKITYKDITLNYVTLVGEESISATAGSKYVYSDGQWLPHVATISFNTDGGNEVSDLAVGSEFYPELPIPAKKGFSFIGWYYNDTLIEAGHAFAASGDHTLTAKWEPLTAINLDYDGDGVADEIIYVDENAESPVYPDLPHLSKDGYSFGGWYYGNTKVEAGAALATSGDHTLTVNWEPLTEINLDYDGDGVADEILYFDKSAESPVYPALPHISKDGYSFDGWLYGDTPVKEGDSITVKEEHTLVANWRKLIWITLNTDGGTVSPEVVYVDTEITESVYPTLPTPQKTGHEFKGWSYNGKLVNSNDDLATSGDHTLVATWSVKSYTITVTTDKATVTGAPTTAYYGDSVTISINYDKSMFKSLVIKNADTGETIYSGNATSYTFTIPAGNVTITASSSGLW
ncbi:MAG: InlB B-repeat-containing protein [Clostridia bacterium]|nr:InlB B-repeat-containing protein [Clostridia bacterium]